MLQGCTEWPAEFAERYRQRGYWRGETLGALLRQRAQQRPDSIALIDGERRWTYAGLNEQADRVAAGLHKLGITTGDRVLVQLPNITEFITICFGLFRLGAIPVLALPAHRESEINHLATLSEAVAYVIPDQHLGYDHRPLARSTQARVPSLRHILVVGDPEELVPFAALQDAAPQLFEEPPSSAVALMLLSGGTTGAPKLIPRTHDDYSCNIRLSAEVTGLTAESRYLVALPAAHNFALGCPGVFGTLYAGATAVLTRDPSPQFSFPIIEREQVTVTALIPPLASLWMEATSLIPANLESLQLLQVGGARFKAAQAAQVRAKLGCNLQQVYGMAEGLLNYTHPTDDEALVHDSQGRPMTEDDELRIVDEQDNEVAAGEVGELLTRGPYTIRGYYRAEEYNRQAFTRDGFYRSGDLVRRLPSGHLIVEGRKKDVINRGGNKVPAEEVESHLLSHPAVRDVALVGLPDPISGERSCACVIPKDKPPTLQELNAHLSHAGLASYKLPDRLVILEQFPVTKLGKVDKGRLAIEARSTTKRPPIRPTP